MLTTAYSQGLAGYFQQSGRFYYFLANLQGYYIYANPLFQNCASHLTAGFENIIVADTFSDADKYQQALQQCLHNPGIPVQIRMKIKLQNGGFSITQWEFSVCAGDDNNPCYIQAIGFCVPEIEVEKNNYQTPEQRTEEEKVRHLARLVETVPDIIISHDKDLKIVSWNKAAEEVYGYKAEEVIGRRVNEFLKFEFQGVSRDELYGVLTTTGGWNGEGYVINRAGRPITVLTAITKIVNENGELKGFVSVSKEITERKNTEDELRRQSAILDNVSDLIMTTDFNLTILSWNKKAEEVVGYTAEEAIGRFIGDIVHPDYGLLTPKEAAAELDKKGFWQGELSIINKYGIKTHVLHTSSYLLNAAGERIAIIGTGKDITERKKAEEQLQKSELFYRNLIAHSLDGVLVTDENGKIGFASPSITAILGYAIEEVVEKITFDFAHPEDRYITESAFREELTGNPQRKFIRVRLRKKSGEWVWCIIRGHNLFQNPFVNGMMVYFYDDTLRKQAEDALIESENKLRSQANILNNVNDIIVTTDLNRVVTSWNKVTEKLTGISDNKVIGKPLRDNLQMDFSPFTIDQVAGIIYNEGIWRGEMFFTGINGNKVYTLLTGSLLFDDEGHQIGLMGVGKDITERKKAEAELQQSEQFYRSMIAKSLDGIVMTDAEGIITYCGPSVTKISGYEPEQLLSQNILKFVHPDDAAAAMGAFITEMDKQLEINYIQLRLKHSDGNWVWCTLRGHNLLDNPTFNAVVIYFTNDSRRKDIEDKLRQSEKEFRDLIQNLRQGVIVQNEKSEMLTCNKAALDMLGLTKDQLLGVTSFDPRWNIIHEDGSNFPVETHPVAVAIQTKKPVRDVVMGVYRPVTKDRTWLLVNAEPVIDKGSKITNVICSFTDITEQKLLSQQLIEQEIQKQKQLTQATIDGQEKERQEIGKELHDNINQHLTITRLYLEVAREKATDEVLEMLNLSNKNLAVAITEIRNISQSLVPPTLGDLGLVESVMDLCNSLQQAHTFNIDFFNRHFKEEQLADNLKLMFFRIIQEQVNNIIRHAAAHNIHIRLQSDAEYVILTVEDDGKGFDPANYKKGQGFSNISNRASLFNGKVEIDAAPGKGCTITVVVPLITT